MKRPGNGSRHRDGRHWCVLGVTTMLLLPLVPVMAQERPAGCLCGSIGIAAGVSQSNFTRDGKAPFLAVRGDAPLGRRWLAGELSVGQFGGEEGFGGKRTYFMSEAQLQLLWPAGVVAPYVGTGIGWFRSRGGDPRGMRSDATVAAAGGVRVAVPSTRLVVRAELRARVIGTYYPDTGSELTAGVAWRW